MTKMKDIQSISSTTITQDLSSSTDFYYTISNINFIPDIMIVRTVNIQGTASSAIYNVFCDLVDGDGIIASTPINISTSQKNRYKINYNVNGSHHFKLYTNDKSTSSATTNLNNLTIHLEFVKYKE